MWLLICDKEAEFQRLLKVFSAGVEYEQKQTSFGALAAFSKNPAQAPHLACRPQEAPRARELLQWSQREMSPRALILTGMATPSTTAANKARYFLPARCYRTVQQNALVRSPILYEDLAFDSVLQSKLRESLISPQGVTEGPLLSVPTRAFERDLTLKMSENMGCAGFDDFTGEFLTEARRVRVSCGFAKFFHHEGELDTLASFWQRAAVSAS